MADKIYIEGLQVGQSYQGELLVTEAQVKTASNGPYVMLTLTDGKATIVGKRWKCNKEIPIGTVLSLICEVSSFNGKMDLNIKGWSIGELPAEDFYKKGPLPIEELWYELAQISMQIVDKDYLRIVDYFFHTYESEMQKAVAAKRVHHDYIGGWMQHTLEVTTLALENARVMKHLGLLDVNESLLIAGAMLHDIGKLYTYDVTNGAISTNAAGKLADHIVVGLQMLADAAKVVDLPGTHYLMLTHCIASHHGKVEWGSPVVPKTIEAHLIFLADYTSTKCTIIQDLPKTMDSDWTEKSFFLGTDIYKGSTI